MLQGRSPVLLPKELPRPEAGRWGYSAVPRSSQLMKRFTEEKETGLGWTGLWGPGA